MVYFHWMPSRVHQAMHMAGTVYKYHMIQMIINVICLPLLDCFVYYISALFSKVIYLAAR